MAGDWIKMRSDLITHPKVVRIMSALKADKLRVIGGLHAVWCLFDMHSVDGTLEGYTPEILDSHLGWPGFSAEMAKIGWLEIKHESLATPRFDEHNGQSAKRRAQETERKRLAREAEELSAREADEKRTREEKRREEDKDKSGSGEHPPETPKLKGRKKAEETLLADYLDSREAENQPPFDSDNTAAKYADSIKLPDPMFDLAWFAFQRAHTGDGPSKTTKKKDWAAHFRNAIEKNWYGLWAIDRVSNDYYLTTTGKQAELAMRSA